jgi:RHS repeat-associated protein
MDARYVFDSTGAATSLSYVKTSNCTSGCTWLNFSQLENIHGQVSTHTGSLSNQTFTYDGVGRLTKTEDTQTTLGCTTRIYEHDKDSNRKKSSSYPPATSGGNCTSSSQAVEQSHNYDDGDRIIDAGYTYDTYGRITTVPPDDAGPVPLIATYFDNDRAHSLTQGETTNVYALDPDDRVRTRTTTSLTGPTSTFHYASDSDEPSWTVDPLLAGYTRNISGITGDLAATHSSATGEVELQLTNLHGDIVATASTSTTATAPTAKFESDEFGIPRASNPRRYGWLGAKQRSTELPSGLIQMGARSYLPQIGRFLQTDPVMGGSANAYDYANQDPINTFDLDGERADGPDFGRHGVHRCAYKRCPNKQFVPFVKDAASLIPIGGGAFFAVRGALKARSLWRAGRAGQDTIVSRKRIATGGRKWRISLTGHRPSPGVKPPHWGRKLPHYHRRPGVGKHRPWEGGF